MSEVKRDNWEEHWANFGLISQINPAQSFRIRLAVDLLELGGERVRVLDIGSGQGDFAAVLKARHPRADLLGLELSDTGCKMATEKVPDARFVQRDLLQSVDPPPDQRNWATHAVCLEVLEHLDDPLVLLRNVQPYLAAGCRVVFTVPGGPMSAFDRHIGHRRHYSPSLLRNLLSEAGFTVRKTYRAGFPFHNLYRLMIIGRGRRLIDDVRIGGEGNSASRAKVIMKMLNWLFEWNFRSSPFGWQMVATALYSPQSHDLLFESSS